MLKDLFPHYNVILGEENAQKVEGDTIFLHRIVTTNSPLQLGVGLIRKIVFAIDVFSSNGVIHDDVVSIIMDRFYNSGARIYNYTPIDGNANFPYNPPESNIVNESYEPIVWGFMDFTECYANDILDEVLQKIVYKRTCCEITVVYAKE